MIPRHESIAVLIARLEAGETVKSTDLIGEHKAMKLMSQVRKMGYAVLTTEKRAAGKGAWWQHQAGRYAEYKLKVAKK